MIWQAPTRPRAESQPPAAASPFWSFLHFSDWLYAKLGRQHSISLPRLAEHLFQYLSRVAGWDPRVVAEALRGDYQRAGRRDLPAFLRALGP